MYLIHNTDTALTNSTCPPYKKLVKRLENSKIKLDFEFQERAKNFLAPQGIC